MELLKGDMFQKQEQWLSLSACVLMHMIYRLLNTLFSFMHIYCS